MLCGLGLHLSGSLNIRHQCYVDEQGVAAANIITELADCLQKRQALNIANGASYFNDGNVNSIGELQDGVFYLVRDMGYYLYSSAQVLSPPLL